LTARSWVTKATEALSSVTQIKGGDEVS
jgi:hypothetical protein